MATESTQAVGGAPPVAAADEPVGIFISDLPFGYVEPPSRVVREIEEGLRAQGNGAFSQQFLKDLLTIKLLIPAESRELRIYNIPQAVEVVRRLANVLVVRYYQNQGEGGWNG